MKLARQRLVVVGAGIGGLATAAAFRRAGAEVTVLERRRNLRTAQAGGGIHLWHNGVRALDRLGLAEPVRDLGARGGVLHTAEFCSHRGAVLASWPIREIERELGAPTVGVSRDQLHALLFGAAEGAELRLGAECVGLTEEESGVRVLLADGEVLAADAVIGADGLNSLVRGNLLGQAPPRPAGYATWQAIVAHDGGDTTRVGLFRVLWGPGARFLFYRLADGKLYWEGQFASAEGGRDPDGGRRDAVLRRFAEWVAPVSEIVEATAEEAISRLDVYDRPPARHWGRGRVTLLGDAAHPMTNAMGQGANQAVEDAVVLAGAARAASSWPEALREYERRRIPRTTTMVRTARNLQRLNRWSNPLACRLRDQLIRVGFSVALRKHAKDMAISL
ncbi:FAD-dependent monooxygenase [Solihabitans fulvus]|uniref:FAD-dependent monooxygenase n=1 Tax=Solihabitans fulvus TaxID=1892852 RepID=UPI0016621BFD|nr:FAD-dependent monooxygenase [Solihabitans fulvus]